MTGSGCEAEQIEALSRQRMAAAEQLQGQIATEGDPARRARIVERSLETLVTMLEEMAPEIDREKQDAADAKVSLRCWRTPSRGRRQAQERALRARPRPPRHGARRPARETAERQAERRGRRLGSPVPRAV